MHTMLPIVVGAVVLALPQFLLVAYLLRNFPSAIRSFAVAMIMLGVGYLISTGAAGDIGRSLLGTARDASTAVKAPAQPAPVLAPAK